jgi:hypothetical protein
LTFSAVSLSARKKLIKIINGMMLEEIPRNSWLVTSISVPSFRAHYVSRAMIRQESRSELVGVGGDDDLEAEKLKWSEMLEGDGVRALYILGRISMGFLAFCEFFSIFLLIYRRDIFRHSLLIP